MVHTLASHARRNLVAYVALVAALAAVGGVAYSSIPDPQGVIHGCYDNTTGARRVIDETVGAELVNTFPDGQNTIRLRCLQYAGGKWPVSISNARLIAMRVDRAGQLDLFKAFLPKVVRAPKKPKLRPLRQILK